MRSIPLLLLVSLGCSILGCAAFPPSGCDLPPMHDPKGSADQLQAYSPIAPDPPPARFHPVPSRDVFAPDRKNPPPELWSRLHFLAPTRTPRHGILFPLHARCCPPDFGEPLPPVNVPEQLESIDAEDVPLAPAPTSAPVEDDVTT